MKNSIYKNFAKKIIKSEAFVSVMIVFVLALGIIGTSYAIYMDVDTDTNYQLVEVGDLSIGFNNGSNIIELTNMTPTSDEIAITQSDNLTSFYIYNTGTYTANYKIKLVSADGNQVETKYINYQICRDNSENCKSINTLNETGETMIYTDELTPNSTALDTNNTSPSAYYFVRIWINDQYTDIEEAKTIKLKINVEATNASGYLDNDNTLAGAILNNPNITINNTEPIFNGVATEELGLFKAEDDYGISYYFRGAQSNNYVNFAGFTWRIVRINGDGSVRLILDGTLDKVKINDIAVGTTTTFKSSPYNDNAYVGYMYGLAGTETDANRCLIYETDSVVDKVSSYTTKAKCETNGGKWTTTAYEATHANIADSTIKIAIDSFYQNYLMSSSDYIADTIFCGDKTLGNAGNGLGTTTTYYGAYDRLFNSLTPSTPTLICAGGASDNYSRYTVSEQIINSASTNGDLTYPIALLSADELVMAGAFSGKSNQAYYLYNQDTVGTIPWWTMSPSYFNGLSASEVNCLAESGSLNISDVNIDIFGVRPVINLKPDVLVAGGDGTKDNTVGDGPYTVKLY